MTPRPSRDSLWDTLEPGPSVADVAERLSSAPRQFLDPNVDVLALAGDVFSATDGPIIRAAHRIRSTGTPDAQMAAALTLWTFASQEIVGPLSVPLRTDLVDAALDFLALRLAVVAPPAKWLVDAERREEAARLLLLWCGQLPCGEDVATARAQLALRDSLAAESALADALAEREHRKAVARQLADARAREAAARYNAE